MATREIIFQTFDSFDEADAANSVYYMGLSPAERLSIALELMAPVYASNPRLERIYRIAELGECPVSSDRGVGI